jgi:hypothetical protein
MPPTFSIKPRAVTSTLWREAQELIGDGGLVVDVADPLEVIEQVMRYFYGLGVYGAKNKAPIEQVIGAQTQCCSGTFNAAPRRWAVRLMSGSSPPAGKAVSKAFLNAFSKPFTSSTAPIRCVIAIKRR